MWEWLEGLKGGAPTFVGSLTGSLLGLLAIIVGALFNAHLNRKRDDRLRDQERKSLKESIGAELGAILSVLRTNAAHLRTFEDAFKVPDLGQAVRILPLVMPKIGLLDIMAIQAVMGAYAELEQFSEKLLMAGGRLEEIRPNGRRMIIMSANQREFMIVVCDSMIERLLRAVDSMHDDEQ